MKTNDYLFDGIRLLKTKSTNMCYSRDVTDCKPKVVQNSNVICNLNEILYVLEEGYGFQITTEHSDIYIIPSSCRVTSRKSTITINQLFKNYKSASDDEDTMQYLLYFFKDSGLNYNDKVTLNPISWYNKGEEINSHYCFSNGVYRREIYKYVHTLFEVKRGFNCLGYVLKKSMFENTDSNTDYKL